jgi:biotin carboxylase
VERLIVLGAGVEQAPLIRAAKKRGLKVFAFDMDENAEGRKDADHFLPISINDARDVLMAARDIRPQGVTTAASDIAVPTMSHVSRALGLAGNSEESASLTTNKDRMREALREVGLATPIVYGVGADLDRRTMKYPVVVKPVDRSGSRGVSLVRQAEDLGAALAAAKQEAFSGRIIAEEYLEGRQFDVQTISYRGEHYVLSTIEEYYQNPPHFIGRQHRVPSRLGADARQRLAETAKAALTALKVENGACHCEMRLGADGEFRVIEVSGRLGGDYWYLLVKLSTGHDYLDMLVDTALGRPPKFAEQAGNKAFLLRYVFEASDWDLLEELKRIAPERLRCRSSGPRPAEGLYVNSSFQKTGSFILDLSEPLDGRLRALLESLDVL